MADGETKQPPTAVEEPVSELAPGEGSEQGVISRLRDRAGAVSAAPIVNVALDLAAQLAQGLAAKDKVTAGEVSNLLKIAIDAQRLEAAYSEALRLDALPDLEIFEWVERIAQEIKEQE